MTSLSAADVELLAHAVDADAAEAGATRRQRPLSYYLSLLAERRTRSLVPPLDDNALRGARRLLREPPFSDDAAENALRGAAAAATAALRALGARDVRVQICTVSASATRQRPAAPFGADDTAIRAGCDHGAGRDYEAKTDLHTIWIAATLLTRRRRTTAVRVAAAAGAEVESFALYTLLHEYSHILAARDPASFEALGRLYDDATRALGAKAAASAADRAEFVADAFGAEHARRALAL